jgi:hypothetical protein
MKNKPVLAEECLIQDELQKVLIDSMPLQKAIELLVRLQREYPGYSNLCLDITSEGYDEPSYLALFGDRPETEKEKKLRKAQEMYQQNKEKREEAERERRRKKRRDYLASLSPAERRAIRGGN